MGASLGSGNDGVNVELNVVPFIDLMSCLTAFLLVTAVWSQYAQIDVKPRGVGGEQGVEEQVQAVSVLLTPNEIWVGHTFGDRRQLRNGGAGYDWEGLEAVLREFQELPNYAERQDIEIAAEDEVTYQHIVSAMDYSMAADFTDIGYIDPASLSVRFKE